MAKYSCGVRYDSGFRDIKRKIDAFTHLYCHFDIEISRRTAGIFISAEFIELLHVSDYVRAISYNSIYWIS